MSRYSAVRNQRALPKSERPHPIWRGIGCLTLLVAPLMAYAAAAITVQIAVNQKWPMPYQLMGYPIVPSGLWSVGALVPLWSFIQSQNNLYAILAIMVGYLVILSAVISVGYAFVYRIIGPARYTPLDAPPPKMKFKRYKR
jgi:hypothetical protein